MNNVLMHYGVKGMKWGVRRYQNYDGTRIKTGSSDTDRVETAKRFFSGDTDARRKEDALIKKEEAEIGKIKRPKNNEWWGDDGRLTKKGRDYLDKVDKVREKYEKQHRALWDEIDVERAEQSKKIFLNDDVKPHIENAREIGNKIDAMRDEYLGPDSDNYKKAFEEYKKKQTTNMDSDATKYAIESFALTNGMSIKDAKEFIKNDTDAQKWVESAKREALKGAADDIEYGFDHYEWREGHKAFDQALKAYDKEVSKLDKQYKDEITTIGKKVLQDQFDKYADDFTMYEIDNFVRYRYDEVVNHSEFEGIKMKDILIHYGVKGMKWGVRKQYEGTGGGGGGGWGPNTIAGGGGPSPLAASMAGNPKKKTLFGKSEADKMGIKDKKKSKWEIEREERRKKQERERAEKDFVDSFNKNWINAYNRAADRQNPIIEKTNSELGDDFDIYTKQGRDYAQKLGESWKSIYTEELMKELGPKAKAIDLGDDWVNAAPFMHDYDFMVMEIDDVLDKKK